MQLRTPRDERLPLTLLCVSWFVCPTPLRSSRRGMLPLFRRLRRLLLRPPLARPLPSRRCQCPCRVRGGAARSVVRGGVLRDGRKPLRAG